MDENATEDYSYDYDVELTPSAPVQFWTYLIFELPSLICAMFLLYHLIHDRHLRQQIHHHVMIILVFLCFMILVIDHSLYLDGWRVGRGNSFPSSPSLCLVWWFMDYGFYGAVSVFLTWAAFERHLLVFHRRQCFFTRRRVLLVHYLPLILLSIYLTIFYLGLIIFPPCENVFYFQSLSCGSYPCYLDITWLNTWDYLIHGVVCNLLEAFFSVSLLFRTIWRRYYSQRRFNWKKYRKMTIQLLTISSISMSINCPQSLIVLVRQAHPDLNHFGESIEPYLFYLTGYIILLIPVISLGCLPELWSKLFFCTRRSRRMIGPMTITANGGQSVLVRGKDDD